MSLKNIIKRIDESYRQKLVNYAKEVSVNSGDDYYEQIDFANCIRNKFKNFSLTRATFEPFYELRNFPFNTSELNQKETISLKLQLVLHDVIRLSAYSFIFYSVYDRLRDSF